MLKIKKFFAKLNLNFIKEISLIIISNLLILVFCVSLFIIFKSSNYIILLVILIIFLNVALLYRYILINNKINLNNLTEIKEAFMYFYLDINNNLNPIVALNNMKNHCSIAMNENIVLLLDEIKNDKSFTPFIKFSNKYHSIIVESLILSIYQLINDYSSKNILNFNNSFKNYKNKVDEIYSKTYKNQFSFITLTPVIGTMVITILVIITTILLVRGYING